jgi:hypothetical protein
VIDGALLLDKPVGVSSNFALQKAKRIMGARKAGHGGTLDPLASGLLVLVFGEATKFAGSLLEGDKEYLATLQLGVTTATGDAEGEVLERRFTSWPGAARKSSANRGASRSRSSTSGFSTALSWKYGYVAARAPISAPWRRISARRSAAARTWRRSGAPPRGAFASKTPPASMRWRG